MPKERSGRTYPLEGTAMTIPQSAPYSGPLAILTCGGSTPYQGIALDNYVSIEPEVPNSNWTIERMVSNIPQPFAPHNHVNLPQQPSKRVISGMTALLNGTYLILNGALQGFAGFGLANFPNHNAVPLQPHCALQFPLRNPGQQHHRPPLLL